MTSRRWRLGIMAACVGLAVSLPVAAAAQCFVYETQWGSFGIGNGQFQYPWAVATDPSGDVYVVDGWRIQKFTSTGNYLNLAEEQRTVEG